MTQPIVPEPNWLPITDPNAIPYEDEDDEEDYDYEDDGDDDGDDESRIGFI